MPSSVRATAAFFIGPALIAAPADAKLSIARAQQICEGAAKVLQPRPKSALADRDQVQATNLATTIILRVQTADNTMVKATSIVDRETSIATLTPSMLAPTTAALTPAPSPIQFDVSNTNKSVRWLAEKLLSEIK